MEECPICLSSLENSSITMTGCCNKSMHSGCYFRCMALKPECPMCRDRKSTRLNSSHVSESRMPSSA